MILMQHSGKNASSTPVCSGKEEPSGKHSESVFRLRTGWVFSIGSGAAPCERGCRHGFTHVWGKQDGHAFLAGAARGNGLEYQGSANQPLNDLGREQARTLIPRLQEIPYDAVYASDLSRVRETATIALGEAHNITFDARLRELSFGIFEGLTLEQIKEQHAETFAAWDKREFSNNPHGGERMDQIIKRLEAFFDEIRAKHEGQSVLIFSHGGLFGILLSLRLGSAPGKWWQFHFGNCSISHLEQTGRGYVLRKLNDTSHLDGDLVSGHHTIR